LTYRKNVDKRLLEDEKTYEKDQLMKEKRSEDYEVLEEVFDKSTLKVIYDFMNKGTINEIHGVVKAGKEAGSTGERTRLATNSRSKSI
jgi:serine/threonine-protein kinase RIO1